jgi:hypothetical protein
LNSPSMMFGGIPVVISEHLPTTKTIKWRTERKWCHWKSRPELRYRIHAKQVPCETVLMFNGGAVMSSASWTKIQVQLAARGSV